MRNERIVWFSWKDMSHPLAGGAEVVTDQLLMRAAIDGNEAVLLCAGYTGCEKESQHNGYKIVRVGNRFTVYIKAWRYYVKHLRGWCTLAIDECNTLPFFAGWYTRTETVMFFHMLCRKIWFYELPQPFSTFGWLAEPLYLRLLKRGKVITVSESTKTDLVRNGFKASDIHIISEGINMTPIKDLTSINKYDKPTILSLGSIRAMKRTIDQIKAFEIAKEHLPKLQMIIAGDNTSKYGDKVCKYILNSKYKNSILLLGKVSSEKKIDIMQRSHLLLVTSVKEGWGLVVTEAASQGTPSIVYDVDGLRDSVHDTLTGIIVTPGYVNEAIGIRMLMRDKDFYNTVQVEGYNLSKKINFTNSYIGFVESIAA